MRITKASVNNYRSIIRKTEFELRDLTVLVGPNNEGKSNLIRALALAMGIIQRWGELGSTVSGKKDAALTGAAFREITSPMTNVKGVPSSTGFTWEEDYPRSKQGLTGAHPTEVRIDFFLDEHETQDMKDRFGITGNGHLPIAIRLKKDSAELTIVKPGKGSKSHAEKSHELAKFISDHLTFIFIPAVRTSRQAVSIANQIVRNRTAKLLAGTDYEDLTAELNKLRRAAAEQIETDLLSSIQLYLPEIAGIQLDSESVQQQQLVRSLTVSDSVTTDIESKGDGVKSLITIALLQELARDKGDSHGVLLALDEPEAHLHARAIRNIEALLRSISDEQQILLATHHQLLVNRNDVSSNIIVAKNRAHPAKDIADIRQALGVELADNLSSAEVVVLVEGLSDIRIFARLLSDVNVEVGDAIRTRRVVLKATRGTGKLASIINVERSNLSKVVAVVDKDDAGTDAVKKVIETNVLDQRDLFQIGGLSKEVEVEDLIQPSVYLPALTDLFGRELSEKDFRTGNSKWAQKLKRALDKLGFAGYDQKMENEAKATVAKVVEEYAGDPLNPQYLENIESLADLIKSKLND